MNVADHPAVARLLRLGVPEPTVPRCPHCGRASEQFFYLRGLCLGCQDCVTVKDWWEV